VGKPDLGGVVLAALPTGIYPFVLAQRNGVYVERSSVAAVVSTLGSAEQIFDNPQTSRCQDFVGMILRH
jgi:hypothetical protein